MITLRNLSIVRGARVLASEVNLTLHAGSRIGVVGPNGCGKSTLLALLAGDLGTESGDIDMPPGLAIARVLQDTPAVERSAIDYVLDGDAELRAVQAALDEAQAAHHGGEVARLHDKLEAIDGYRAQSRAATLLHGLGFAFEEHSAPVASFSGGWRMRLNLARALIARSDLLLLDEPTNHLDLDAIVWLERWLASYSGTLAMVSHDREFLDATVQRVLHFDGRTIVSYSGNYTDFEVARAGALATQQAAYAKQQREIEHLRRFVDRFRAKATKASQAQSRLKALARMEAIAPAHVDSAFSFRFDSPTAAPSPLIVLQDARLGYGERTVLHEVELSILPGSRLALLGRNGAGKSTLVKALAAAESPLAGKRTEGRGLAIGYFAQHQLEQLRDDESALQHLLRIDAGAREQDLRDYLGRFGFGGDQALAPVGPFSGGERSRLALALIVRRRPNLLLLDEPTNHLDLEMRHALTLALQEYEGAVVLVSHDRHMVRTTADELWLVAGGQVSAFDGDLDDYRAWLQSDKPVRPGSADARAGRKEARRERARRQDEAAARRRPLEIELRALENEMGALGDETDAIDGRLIEAASGSVDAGFIADLHKRRAEIATRVQIAEERWYELQDALSALEQA
ncbi:MAG: ATP-binding cassette domain-containing protein [Burkholderiales bacterium]